MLFALDDSSSSSSSSSSANQGAMAFACLLERAKRNKIRFRANIFREKTSHSEAEEKNEENTKAHHQAISNRAFTTTKPYMQGPYARCLLRQRNARSCWTCVRNPTRKCNGETPARSSVWRSPCWAIAAHCKLQVKHSSLANIIWLKWRKKGESPMDNWCSGVVTCFLVGAFFPLCMGTRTVICMRICIRVPNCRKRHAKESGTVRSGTVLARDLPLLDLSCLVFLAWLAHIACFTCAAGLALVDLLFLPCLHILNIRQLGLTSKAVRRNLRAGYVRQLGDCQVRLLEISLCVQRTRLRQAFG